MNSGKTKYMSYNLSQEVSDFKYLGAWMASTEKDIKMRKGAAWSMQQINKDLEIHLTKATETLNFCRYGGISSLVRL